MICAKHDLPPAQTTNKHVANNIEKLSFYLTVNTLHPCHNNQLATAVYCKKYLNVINELYW
jgi:hypothetical protein